MAYSRRSRFCRRLPLAAKTALTITGAMGGRPGSPTPPGDAKFDTIQISMIGISMN